MISEDSEGRKQVTEIFKLSIEVVGYTEKVVKEVSVKTGDDHSPRIVLKSDFQDTMDGAFNDLMNDFLPVYKAYLKAQGHDFP